MNDATLRAHVPVMVDEVIDALQLQPAGCYVDGTFGRGGHTAAILERLEATGLVIAFDRDPEAVCSRPDLREDPRLEIVHAPYSHAAAILEARGLIGRVQGVLLDLGVSSPQIDDPCRGFSFRADGPLDMRMDTSRGLTVAEWLNSASETEIRDCLWQLGEERKSRHIAARICLVRRTQPITSTRQLAELVGGIVRGEHRIDPATRTFQALRILINRELEELRIGLTKLVDVLAVAGRLVVISFHSLEDRIVKRFFRDQVRGTADQREVDRCRQYRLVFRKSVTPQDEEVHRNPRARSARLRVLERTA